MLQNFFRLNDDPSEFRDEQSLRDYQLNHDTIRNYIYKPDFLKEFKFKNKTFNNVSFSKTLIENVDFINCHFIDCLFIGTEIKKCKFIEASFSGCNTHAIRIYKTYINPTSFDDNFKKYDYSYSNIVVHLYQELYDNSVDQQIIEFSKKAKYNLLKWEGRLLISKHKYKQPYKIPICEFLIQYIPNIIFRKVFGYGLRLRNFIVTFSIVYICSFILNYILWEKYKLATKDIEIASFSSEKYNNLANFYYTNDVLTKIVDSQFQPTSDLGMNMLTFQGILGFILFSFLITVLINKFIK